MEKKVVCFYHSRDLDGWTSAAIVKKKYPNTELTGWDYGDPVPMPRHNTLHILVDICFPVTDMEMYAMMPAYSTIWIDHHESAIDQMNGPNVKSMDSIDGVRDTQFAACELAWRFFFPELDMPEQVRLLGMYDSFRHKNESEKEKVFFFQYAARAMAENPEQAAQFLISAPPQRLGSIINTGGAIHKYLCVEAKGIFGKAFELHLLGYIGLAVNRERFNPVNFGLNYHKDGYEFFACFWYDGIKKKWIFSLYNDDGKLNVSEVCKELGGGGGHPKAAGFVTKNLSEILS